VHCIEFFAGVSRIASKFAEKYASQAFDTDRSPSHDLTQPYGILLGLWSIWNLQAGGLAHFGLVCKSYCWINSGTHKRSIAFPMGRSSLEYVKDGTNLALSTAPFHAIL